MKRIKRLVSLVLTFTLVLSCFTLSACEGKVSGGSTISMGQWLALVDQAFGMDNYTNDEPYFKSISKDNVYFAAVQIAAEWEVIEKDADIDIEKPLTYEEALVTLVNVGAFLSEEASKDDKVKYGIEHFNPEIREYWVKHKIEPGEAMNLLSTAASQWSNKTYDHVVEEASFKEGVVDLTSGDHCVTDYLVEENVIKLPKAMAGDIKAGSTYVLPPNGAEYIAVQAFRAEEVYEEGDYLCVRNEDTQLELEDVAERIFIQETFTPTMDHIRLYDNDGNLLNGASSTGTKLGDFSTASLLRCVKDENGNAIETGAGKISQTVTLHDGTEIGVDINTSGDFSLKANVKSANRSKSSTHTRTLKGGFEISNLKITNDVDFGMFKGLKSASLKVDYTTKTSFGMEKTFVDHKLVNNKYVKGYIAAIEHEVLDIVDVNDTGLDQEVTLCKMEVYTVGLAAITLDVKLKVKFDGSLSIEITETGSKGVEYKNGNVRIIKDAHKDVDAKAKGNLEITLSVGPALYIFGVKDAVIALSVEGGGGLEVGFTLHIADIDEHLIEEGPVGLFAGEAMETILNDKSHITTTELKKIAMAQGKYYESSSTEIDLHFDYCIDMKVYAILRIGFEESCLLSKLLGSKLKLKWEIFGSNNASLGILHLENGKLVKSCTLKYKPFDDAPPVENTEATEAVTEEIGTENLDKEETENIEESETVTEEATEETQTGDVIVLSTAIVSGEVGDSKQVTIEQIPTGYKRGDLTYSIADSKVASVDQEGNVTLKSEGSTMVTVSTKDEKFYQYCAVTVATEEVMEFTPLEL